MKLRCGTLAIIIAIVIGLGGGAGIFAWGYHRGTEKETEINVDQEITQIVRSEQTTKVNTFQGQITVKDMGAYGVLNVNFKDRTNVNVTVTTNSITNTLTNYIRLK